jgi:glycosyltransferase involved in cell wall biosynthesis
MLTAIGMICFSLMAMYWIAMWILNGYGFSQLTTFTRTMKSVNQRDLDFSTDEIKVSVIVAAKDEAGQIEQTVRDLWQQTLLSVEWIVVNDRSTDSTGEILDRLATEYQVQHQHLSHSMSKLNRFQVIHIEQLPEGWLGKNHALWTGAKQARGQWLLFTDADIRFHRETLRDAYTYVMTEQADHLTILPQFIARTYILKSFVSVFIFSLNTILRPWRANQDHHRHGGIGIGAFNLVRQQAYHAIGTHEAIAMRPDDDLILGVKIKECGYKQRCVIGGDKVSVEWYPTLHQAIRGLEKNVFAGFGYQASYALLMIFSFWFQYHLPYLILGGIVLTGKIDAYWMEAFFMIIFLQMTVMGWVTRKFTGTFLREILLLPITTGLVTYTLARSVILAIYRQGVYWRGTFYSLSALKKMKRP